MPTNYAGGNLVVQCKWAGSYRHHRDDRLGRHV
jgi:hypothetical protein